MSSKRPLSRLSVIALAFILAVVALAAPAQQAKAVDADSFYLSWPYEVPPKSNLNAFSPDALNNGGFGPWAYLLEPTFGYYVWEKQEWRGWLAKSFGYSTDGKKYTITLRNDLTWSDGAKVTSKDVVTTYNMVRLAGGNGEFGQGIESVKAVDDYTIDFNLNKPPSQVLQRLILKELVVSNATYGALGDKIGKLLADGAGKTFEEISATDAWKAVQKEVEDFRPTQIISSGPYTLDMKDVQTSQLVMRRTDKTTFGKLAKFDKIVVYNGDTDVTTPLILNGELYYATDYFPPATEKTFIDKGIKILRAPTFSGPGLLINHAVKPLDNLQLRQAMAYAINRVQTTKVAYEDIGKPVKYMANISDAQVPNYLDAATVSSFNTYENDLKKAADLMGQAGFKKSGDAWVDASGKPLEFELSAPSDYTDWMPAAQDVTDQLTAFGIKITLRAIPDSQHRPEIRDGKFQLAIRLWGFPNALPFYAYRYVYLQASVGGSVKAGTGYAQKQTIGGKDYDFAALVSAVGAGTDPAPQNEAIKTLATEFNTQLPMIPLIERYFNCPLNTANISGLPPDSDPLWGNVSGSDNAIVVLLMEGTIGPKK